MELLCPDSVPSFLGLLDLSIAPPLLFYSYIPSILLSLLIGFYVLIRTNYSLLGKILFSISFFFALWVLNVFVLWVAAYNDAVMFSWQINPLIEIFIFIFTIYFTYVFTHPQRSDVSPTIKLLLYLVILPIIVFLPTRFNVSTYDINSCEGVLSYLWIYMYGFEVASIVWILVIGLSRRQRAMKGSEERKRVSYGLFGIVAFLLLFVWSNIAGEIFEYQVISLLGALGMMVFLGFLAYLIVRFKIFNLKLIGSNVLVFALWIITAALLLIDDVRLLHIIVAITLVLTVILGVFLIRGVRREVFQREQIEKLLSELGKSNDKLWVANEKLKDLDKQKTEFVSIASHQLRSPLTVIKGYSSMLLEGSFGEISDKVREAIDRVFQSSQRLVLVIEDFLNISRIELGTMKYEWSDFDLREIVETVVRDVKHTVEKNGLKLFFEYDTNLKYVVRGDQGKLSQVVSNLIDNAMKYTKHGSIKVKLEKFVGKVRLSVQDTGIGIGEETMPKLFEKFSRASDAGKTNIAGTGLGLYVAKEIVTAHKGKIWAESEGVGKGSTFIVEI